MPKNLFVRFNDRNNDLNILKVSDIDFVFVLARENEIIFQASFWFKYKLCHLFNVWWAEVVEDVWRLNWQLRPCYAMFKQ